MSYPIFFDRTFDKNRIKELVCWKFRCYGQEKTLEFAERLKTIGFRMAVKAGLSIRMEDLLIPKQKQWISRVTKKKILKIKIYERLGSLTSFEVDHTLLITWVATSERLKNAILETFRKEEPLNPLYLMTFSGARGNLTQVRQLIGMRGLIVEATGRLVKYPIPSNFKEGITLAEFLISCYGARKGIIDTALRTSRAGYLTRRLVDISHFQIISMQDCGTRRGLRIFPLNDQNGDVLVPMEQRRKGRALVHPLTEFGTPNFFFGYNAI